MRCDVMWCDVMMWWCVTLCYICWHDATSYPDIELVQSDKHQSTRDLLLIFQQICSAVAVLHSHHSPIHHWDIKVRKCILDGWTNVECHIGWSIASCQSDMMLYDMTWHDVTWHDMTWSVRDDIMYIHSYVHSHLARKHSPSFLWYLQTLRFWFLFHSFLSLSWSFIPCGSRNSNWNHDYTILPSSGDDWFIFRTCDWS